MGRGRSGSVDPQFPGRCTCERDRWSTPTLWYRGGGNAVPKIATSIHSVVAVGCVMAVPAQMSRNVLSAGDVAQTHTGTGQIAPGLTELFSQHLDVATALSRSPCTPWFWAVRSPRSAARSQSIAKLRTMAIFRRAVLRVDLRGLFVEGGSLDDVPAPIGCPREAARPGVRIRCRDWPPASYPAGSCAKEDLS